ncbi:MAG: hypothetical protein AAGE94_06815 [Acidobacteriota bacterium]
MLPIRCCLALCLLATLAVPSNAAAQDRGITLGLLGGVGGSPDSEDYTESSFQFLAGLDIATRTHVQLRLGQLDLALDGRTTDLSYVTLGSEYRFDADYYDSGIILGLGWYQLDGSAGVADEDSIGVYGGVTGDFPINDRWSVLVELTGHWADLDAAQVFLHGHVGLAIHF